MSHDEEVECLPLDSTDDQRQQHYAAIKHRICMLVDGETDLTAVMATIACELHNSFEYYHWTGSHGCLRIPIGKGVCGAAALDRKPKLVQDVHSFPGHIACASSTQSEIVVPYFSGGMDLMGVIDVDSNCTAAFREVDRHGLEAICEVFKKWNAFREYVL